jgi:hypothetical protein
MTVKLAVTFAGVRNIGAIAIAITIFVYSSTAHAIVMRHDVDPDAYLLNDFVYQSVVAVNGCTATLIATRWILTAAHCVDSASTLGPLQLMAEEVEIIGVDIHPGYATANTPIHDVALLELSAPVSSIIPTAPYEGMDELGQVMKLAGFGDVGDAEQGIYESCSPCDLRGADNRVTVANDYHLRFRFDNPRKGASLPLEGVGGPGDSGGPAFIENSVGRFVAGVSSFGRKSYGEFDQYIRVSQELDWLLEVMGDEYPGFYSGPLYSETEHNDRAPNYKSGGGGSVAPVFLLLMLGLVLYRRWNPTSCRVHSSPNTAILCYKVRSVRTFNY